MENFELQKYKEDKSQIEKLAEYAHEHYEKYAVRGLEILELLKTISANKDKFQKEILPNVPKKQVDKIFNFIDGNKDEQFVSLLKRSNFDYDSLLASDIDKQAKAQALLEAVLKAQSYDEAVKRNQGRTIDFFGFENDSDISDVQEFIYQSFGAGLLQKCLISKVQYIPDKVNVSINGVAYILPVDVYAEWEKQMPEVKKRKFRAESFVLWNTDPNFSKKFILTPIYFYSFYGERPEELDYLESIPKEEKMRYYKLGTISHEIAHHIYGYLMGSDERKRWKNLVDSTPNAITDYAKSYENDELKYDEFFAEAVRLKTTVPDYLKINFPEIDRFLKDNFPDIKGIRRMLKK